MSDTCAICGARAEVGQAFIQYPCCVRRHHLECMQRTVLIQVTGAKCPECLRPPHRPAYLANRKHVLSAAQASVAPIPLVPFDVGQLLLAAVDVPAEATAADVAAAGNTPLLVDEGRTRWGGAPVGRRVAVQLAMQSVTPAMLDENLVDLNDLLTKGLPLWVLWDWFHILDAATLIDRLGVRAGTVLRKMDAEPLVVLQYLPTLAAARAAGLHWTDMSRSLRHLTPSQLVLMAADAWELILTGCPKAAVFDFEFTLDEWATALNLSEECLVAWRVTREDVTDGMFADGVRKLCDALGIDAPRAVALGLELVRKTRH